MGAGKPAQHPVKTPLTYWFEDGLFGVWWRHRPVQPLNKATQMLQGAFWHWIQQNCLFLKCQPTRTKHYLANNTLFDSYRAIQVLQQYTWIVEVLPCFCTRIPMTCYACLFQAWHEYGLSWLRTSASSVRCTLHTAVSTVRSCIHVKNEPRWEHISLINIRQVNIYTNTY